MAGFECDRVVVLGATSLVGAPLIAGLCAAGVRVLAVSRNPALESEGLLEWCSPDQFSADVAYHRVADFDSVPWISLAPLWVLHSYLDREASLVPSRIIAMSSTSRFSKGESAVSSERALALRLAAAENGLTAWADARRVPWLILRPTLIHGFGRDRNVAEIARFISRFGFFPVLGRGAGLRRPIHAAEVADACLRALSSPQIARLAMTVSGGEVLSYTAMVTRIFELLACEVRIVHVPRCFLRMSLAVLHVFGFARDWSIGMADRMDQDLDFDHQLATELLGFQARPFRPDVLNARGKSSSG